MTRARTVLVVALALLSPAVGCSMLSESVTSPSESLTGTGHAIGGSFQSLSTSASQELTIDAKRSAYARELRAWVAAFARAGGGSSQDFERGIGRIAESHGITHWEAQPVTPYAIGQGMREANLPESELRALCERAGPDSAAAKLALEGWRDAGS